MNQEQILERKCFDFAQKLTGMEVKNHNEAHSWRMRQLHFTAVKTGVFVRKSLMHDSRREHAHHMLQACVHALESEYWLQLLSMNTDPEVNVDMALGEIREIISLLTNILKLKSFNPNY